MAKDLPYFKFFCSEWNDGDITLEDFNLQGLFINFFYKVFISNFLGFKFYVFFKKGQ